jgi:hypothetical protein
VTYAGFVNGDDAGDLGGSLAFGTAATPASPVGTYPVSVSGLTSADYVFEYQPGTLTITPATPVIVWSDPASIEYGTALGASQLDALANVPGTYVYGPPAGAILGAGTHTLMVTFTPTDTTNYVSVSATVELEVVPADQTIDFPALPDVSTDAGPISLAATASSGLAVSYSVSGPCEVVGSTLTITGPGTCVVTASQPGDANHEPADPVSQSFDIDDGTDQPPPPPPTSTGGPSIDTDKDTLPAGDEVIVTATGFDPGSTVEVRILPDGDPVQVVADAEGTIEVAITIPPGTAPGSLQIEATGVDPDGGALTLTATVTVSALVLPDTSTVALPAISYRTGPPAWGLILAVLGLLLLAVAIGVRASAPVAARRRERPRPH